MSKLSKFMGGGNEPVGAIKDFVGLVDDPDWLPARGQRLLKEAYPELSGVVGDANTQQSSDEYTISLSTEITTTTEDLSAMSTTNSINSNTAYPIGKISGKVGSTTYTKHVYIPYNAGQLGFSLIENSTYADAVLGTIEDRFSTKEIQRSNEGVFNGFETGPKGTFASRYFNSLLRPLSDGVIEIFDILGALQEHDESITDVERLSILYSGKGVAIVSDSNDKRFFISFIIDYSSNIASENSMRVVFKVEYPYASIPAVSGFIALEEGDGYYNHKSTTATTSVNDYSKINRVFNGVLVPIYGSALLGEVVCLGELSHDNERWMLIIRQATTNKGVYLMSLESPGLAKTLLIDMVSSETHAALGGLNAGGVSLPGRPGYFLGTYSNERPITRIEVLSLEGVPDSLRIAGYRLGNWGTPGVSTRYREFWPYCYIVSDPDNLGFRWEERNWVFEKLPPEEDEFILPFSQPYTGLVRHVKAK